MRTDSARAYLVGRLAESPQLKYVGRDAICRLEIQVGEARFGVVARAEVAHHASTLSKGDRVRVAGELAIEGTAVPHLIHIEADDVRTLL